MQRLKKLFSHSVMNYIHLSLFTIIGIALLSIFFSFWITDKTDNDAKAINLSGSMRMQTFQIGLAMQEARSEVVQLVTKLDQTWNSPFFRHLHSDHSNPELTHLFDRGAHHWFETVKPKLLSQMRDPNTDTQIYELLKQQANLTDSFVNRLQLEAEQKIRNLRTLQLIALLITTIVGSLIFYLLKNRVEAPLNSLTKAAIKIGEGDIEQKINAKGEDELALLGKAFNQMSQSISETYQTLEGRVAERTEELQRQNTILEFLFNTAREALDNPGRELDYHGAVDTLSTILGEEKLELCLFTSQGDKPYMQLDSAGREPDCEKINCADCKGNAPFDTVSRIDFSHRFPITQHEKQYGVIQLQTDKLESLPEWKSKLLQSTADQFAIALSLHDTQDQEHRLAMLNERTVIARELHDSLAQSLSYLQIQVTRLQKSKDKQKYEMQQAIIDEIREGLSSAYRHLRELLTTFRIKMDIKGLRGAIEETVKQLQERSAMQVNLSYHLQNLPLNPMEEIHLLQITREASQNALNHSRGSQINISLAERVDSSVELCIEDDGIGLSDNPEKLNHYGLAIMQERTKQLGGELLIEAAHPKGTRITLRFIPQTLNEAA